MWGHGEAGMRRSPFIALMAVLLLGTPTAAYAVTADQAPVAALAAVRVAGTAVVVEPATGRMTVTVDDTVGVDQLAALRATATSAGAVIRREPGRLRPLIAGGQSVYAGGVRCSLGANAHLGSVYYFISAGHCVSAGATWSADGVVIGARTAVSFPTNDYGLVRYTNTQIPHPSAVYTHPGLLNINGYGNATVGMAVCRSGATTGVRCGRVTALNATVNYSEGSVTGLIRTNICAEPGDSGGPLYVAATGILLGILSGGSGNCTTGGVSYYQPIGEILSAYGVTLP
jgi:streptogrisin B